MYEQHDVSKIKVAQTWDVAEYGGGQGIAGAQQRASLDNSTGKVALYTAGALPWHGLGVNVTEAGTSTEAIVLASLNWEVEKRQLQYYHEGRMLGTTDYGVIRQDTGAHLGTVTNAYQPIQNREAFAFLDKVLAQYGARYEAAGSLYGGKKVFMLAKLPKQSFFAQENDRVECFALFINDHTGTGSGWCFPTTTRVVCANTYRIASGRKANGIELKHVGDMKSKIADGQHALGLAVEQTTAFGAIAQSLVQKRIDQQVYFDKVLTKMTGIPSDWRKVIDQLDADPDAIAFAVAEMEKKEAKRLSMEEGFMNMYESGRCTPRGSAWAAFNAITDFADHQWYKAKSNDKRFEAILNGHVDALKQVAYEFALSV